MWLGGRSKGGFSATALTAGRIAGYRCPDDLISYAVWLDFRFPLSLRMVEEMLGRRAVSRRHTSRSDSGA
jgi:transposase-like protein